MKFVDFGDCAFINVQDIRLLPTRFQQLPCLAVNVKLGGSSILKFGEVNTVMLSCSLGRTPKVISLCTFSISQLLP